MLIIDQNALSSWFTDRALVRRQFRNGAPYGERLVHRRRRLLIIVVLLAVLGFFSDIVADLNRHIFNDVSQTYRFMTLFILALDDSKNRFDWIRAGHEPALLYAPETDAFTELKGAGVALGLDADYPYAANRTSGFSKDKILVLASDGISETRSTNGEMFGKERLRRLIRSSAHGSARDIADRIFDAVGAFSKGTMPEDDRTLVVIKRV